MIYLKLSRKLYSHKTDLCKLGRISIYLQIGTIFGTKGYISRKNYTIFFKLSICSKTPIYGAPIYREHRFTADISFPQNPR